jgi:glutaredoxin
VANQSEVPIVYTIRGCDSCVKLLKKWDAENVVYDERRVELSQATLDEARQYGKLVPIVVWPDGRVEQGFGDSFGCFI